MRRHRDNYIFLTTAPIGKVIRTMAIPTIISMLVTSIYNIVDTWYVGMLNTQATAAVGIVFPFMSVIQAIGFLFGQGSGTYISRKLGAKDTKNASRMAATGFFSALVPGLLIAILGLSFLHPLSIVMGSTPTILPYTEKYLGMVLLGTPFMAGSMVLNNQMRFPGNAANAMYGMMTGALMNVLLVPLFMFVFDLGILGCGIGTVVSQISAFFVLLWMSYQDDNIHLHAQDITLKWTYFKEIIRGGTPSLTRQGLASIATLMLNVAAGAYGDAAIAGMSIVTRISFVVFASIIGIGQGFQPLCGFCFGARLFHRVREGFFYCIKLGVCFLIPIGILCFIFAEDLIDILRHDPEVVSVGAAAIRWQVITYPLAAVITIGNQMLQTSGQSLWANIVASARNGLFFIPLILILPYIWGLEGVEMCQAVADVFSFILTVYVLTRYFRKLKRLERKE